MGCHIGLRENGCFIRKKILRMGQEIIWSCQKMETAYTSRVLVLETMNSKLLHYRKFESGIEKSTDSGSLALRFKELPIFRDALSCRDNYEMLTTAILLEVQRLTRTPHKTWYTHIARISWKNETYIQVNNKKGIYIN